MPENPWGEQDPPAVNDPPPLPPHLAELAALDGPGEVPKPFIHPRPEELPEVNELLGAGWRVLDDNPMWSFFPAVWPKELRCWVPDRLPRLSRSTGDDSVTIIPWTPEVAEDIRRSGADLLARVGLPPPPPGRIWLLRSPWPSIGVESIRSLVSSLAAQRGGGDMLDHRLLDAGRDLLSWDEEQVWDWWPGARGEVARAWRARGRVGEDAAPVIAARLDPDLLSEYEEAHGLDEAAAMTWTSTLYLYGREGLERAVAWLELGLSPADIRGLDEADPAEVTAWLGQGYELDEIRTLYGLSLDRALTWRAAGFDARQIRRLLQADRTLTPSEALRFSELGIDDPCPWVEVGFDAAEARAWTDLDVLPNEARVSGPRASTPTRPPPSSPRATPALSACPGREPT